MATHKKIKIIPLDVMIDKHIGKKGSFRRNVFEDKLKLDLGMPKKKLKMV